MSEIKVVRPDILDCLANLSSDEVFTPPNVVNKMLDMLPQELFTDPTTKFLDPFTKSGVFLREIAKRLDKGLTDKIPDKDERIRHIFTTQVYGIAITQLTALFSRRSVYCNKDVNNKRSTVRDCFKTNDGNIAYHRCKHTWVNGSCKVCGASKKTLSASGDVENYAYPFLHDEVFMKQAQELGFDVVIGNPPYQMDDGGGNGASARPIYHLFVQQAKRLDPKFLVMITPSRWFTGGKGLDEFRDEMLKDAHIRCIHDYIEASDCFSGVQIKGGVSYFLWDRDTTGMCTVYSHKGADVDGPIVRPLLERGSDVFIRYNKAIGILHKVTEKKSRSFESLVSARMPFGLPNTYKGKPKRSKDTDVPIYVSGNDRDVRGSVAYAPMSDISRGHEMIKWQKVFIAKAGSGSDSFPHPILPKPFYGEPGTICNESYLVIGPFKSKEVCSNVMTYIATRFFRFLVLLKKNSQNAAKGVYQFVPMQDFSKPWTDKELYKTYKLTPEEIAFIESMIRPMDVEEKE